MRVLFVDDDADIRSLYSQFLCEHGYDVSVAVDGQDALEMLERNNDFGAIIIDRQMPRMTGDEFVTKVRYSGYPIILHSGCSLGVDRIHGLFAFVLKGHDAKGDLLSALECIEHG